VFRGTEDGFEQPAYIAIRRLSSFANPPDDWLVCVIKAYLDGTLADGVVGLASFVASEKLWASFERGWRELLVSLRMPYVHMSDLSERRTAFKGKDPTQAENAARDIVSHLASLNSELFRRYSCVIRSEDFNLAASLIPRLRNESVYGICVNHCTGRLFTPRYHDEGDPERNIEIRFDGNEAFIEHIRRVWNVERDNPHSWASRVFEIGEIYDPDHLIIPKQAADVLAWVAQRYRVRKDKKDWFDVLCGGEQTQTNHHDFYDFDALIAKYGES
jgi:hypothetical protein